MKLGEFESFLLVTTSLDKAINALLTVVVKFRIESVTDAISWMSPLFPIQLHTCFSNSFAAGNSYMIRSPARYQVDYSWGAM